MRNSVQLTNLKLKLNHDIQIIRHNENSHNINDKVIQQIKEKEVLNIKRDRTWKRLADIAILNKIESALGGFWGVSDVWKDEPCFILGAGLSLRDVNLKDLKDFHTITINHVIEDFYDSEFHVFLDQRFLDYTDLEKLSKYKGRIFASNKTKWQRREQDVIYKALSSKEPISGDISKGLFCGRLSGTVALNLALITGANPIYIVGFDCGAVDKEGIHHYKENYGSNEDNEERIIKYQQSAGYFNAFEPIKERIFNCVKNSYIKTFKKIKIDDAIKYATKFNENKRIEIVSKEPEICHIIKMNNMEEMNDFSRIIYNETKGKHSYFRLDDIGKKEMPKADIYLLECFINDWDKFRDFKKPISSKVISLIHSSSKCQPATCSDKVVVLTEKQKQRFPSNKLKTIGACLDHINYEGKANYYNNTFGRITRISQGKIHPQWYKIVNNILNKNDKYKCIMYTQNKDAVPYIPHERLIFDSSVNINDPKLRAKKLKELSIYVHAHNGTIETFSLSMLECMALSMPIIVLQGQPYMEEVLNGAGIITSIDKLENEILSMLNDIEKKRYYGELAYNRSLNFEKNKIINEWNKLYDEVLL